MQIGWKINIETSNGVVGMWTSWLGNSLKIFYPLGVIVPDEVIMEILDVSMANMVNYRGYILQPWGRYVSEKLKDDAGRVWIDHNCMHSCGEVMHTINNGILEEHYAGHRQTNTIWTFEFNFCTPNNPDAPTNEKKFIQLYTDKFIKLLVEIAKIVGDIKAVNFDSGLVLYKPETLGCKYKTSRKSQTQYCYVKSDEFELMLKSGNSLVPWTTIIRYPMKEENLSVEWLRDKLDSWDNSESSFNPIPLINHFIQRDEIYSN